MNNRRSRFGLLTLLFALGISVIATGVQAHPLAPALLQLQQVDDSQWSVLWRQSQLRPSAQPLKPILPADCNQVAPLQVTREAGSAVTARWRIRCDSDGLAGSRLRVQGVSESPINVIVRIQPREGIEYQTLLRADRDEIVLPDRAASAAAGFTETSARYLNLGVQHLLFGPDHLLFVLALVLLVSGLRRLALTLTAFTVGHSITLSVAALELVQVNPGVMEFGIAASLVLVARELLSRHRSMLGRWPASLALAFGLLHGLGFAAALSDIGLPPDAVVPALLFFNIGIELGQLAVAFGVLALVYLARPLQRAPGLNLAAAGRSGVLSLLPAYVIGSMGIFWCLQRLPAVV